MSEVYPQAPAGSPHNTRVPFHWHGTWDEFNEQVRDAWNGREGQPLTAHVGYDKLSVADAAEVPLVPRGVLYRELHQLRAANDALRGQIVEMTEELDAETAAKWRARAGLGD